MVRRLLVTVLLSCALMPTVVAAQETPDLVVSVRDEGGAGVAATVIVRDSAGQHDLARASADATGMATFAALPVNEVRVAIEGALSNGTAFYQAGDDVRGIRLWLSAGTTPLDVRVEADGLIQPDPATMIAQEVVPLDLATIPTAEVAAPLAVATPQIQPAAAVPRPSAVPAPRPAAAPPDDAEGSLPFSGLLLIGVLGAAIVGVVLMGRRA